LLIALLLAPSAAFSFDSDGHPVAAQPASRPAEKPKIDFSTPQKLIGSAIAEVLNILNDESLAGEAKTKERRERLRKILLEAFDMDTISALILSKYYKNFSQEQRVEFTDVFSHLLFSTYIGHIEGFSGEEIVYDAEKDLAKGRVEIASRVKTDGADILVDYRLMEREGKWRVYDVKAEGVSLVSNYRSQFLDILINRSPAELIEDLKGKVAKNEGK
jgi:phospholipid transport system substrate-binding protein